jgi:putative cardiolipin synthase
MGKIYSISVLLLALFVTGCTSIPKNYPKAPSYAYKNYKATSLGKTFDKDAAKHPGKSGFSLVEYGREAFSARVAMLELAEKSLDIQYYLWESDETGRLLADYLLKAADRGVKVRLLMDDIGLQSRDNILASIDAHPKIEIRIFNPFADRTFHGINFLTDYKRVNHRMHNKVMVMDNTVALIGGRNIGNHYFGIDDTINFRDLDIIGAGPIVREVSTVFDYFWNGSWSVPMKVLVKKKYTEEDYKNIRAKLTQDISQEHYPYPLDSDVRELTSHMTKIRNRLIWAPAKYVWNDPVQIKLDAKDQKGMMIDKLRKKLQTLKKSYIVESPYFIPGDQGSDTLIKLHKRGVKVQVLTNSQKSNDVEAAFAGYEPYRKELIEHGLNIYELRPDAGGNLIINKKTKLGKVVSGLHTKAMVFDEESSFVGSFNLDPRSSSINTEGGIYVESPAFAKRVLKYMHEGVKAENAYRLVLDKNGDIAWMTETKGKKEVYHSDPHTSTWDKLKVNVLQVLPLEDQL